jgi:hypothetical protein
VNRSIIEAGMQMIAFPEWPAAILYSPESASAAMA